MKIRLEMEIDLSTGTYDVRFHNLTHPGEEIDITKLGKVVTRVLENVAVKTTRYQAPTASAMKSQAN